MATRPRSSILVLFDPLSPPRDAPSPDSDKENSAHFTHKRRLVDVGDVTIDDPSLLHDDHLLDDDLSFNDDENDTLTFRQMASATPARLFPQSPPRSNPRTPLADIALDHDSTPIARTKVYRRPVPAAPSSLSRVVDLIPVTVAPQDSPLASVINAVNSSGLSFANTPGRPTRLLDEDLGPPQIRISSPDALADSLSAMNLETPIGAPLTETTIPPPPSPPALALSVLPPQSQARLRPNPPKTSSHDPNRSSVDLHSSFHLQLQSTESSFDLLNDKISFFASGSSMDSFLDEDDSFDLDVEEAKMELALQRMRLEEETDTRSIRRQSLPMVISPSRAAQNSPANSSPTLITTPEPQVRRRSRTITSTLGSPLAPPSRSAHVITSAPMSKVPSPSSLHHTPEAPRPEPVFDAPTFAAPVFVPPPAEQRPAPVFTPVSASRDTALVPPPAVPALRIVKRPKGLGHEKASSTSSASSSEGPSVPAPVAARPVQRTMSVPTIAGPAPMVARQVSAGAGALARPARGPASSSIASASANRPTSGPRRVPIPEGSTRPGGVVGKPASTAVDNGPRRVPAATATAPMIRAPSASGLKQPVRYGAGASALPRPVASGVSRLPAPVARPRPGVPAPTLAGTAGRSLPIRRAFGGQ